jgi:hypothetical protein
VFWSLRRQFYDFLPGGLKVQQKADGLSWTESSFVELVCAPPTSASRRKVQCELNECPDWTASVQSALSQGVLPIFCHSLLLTYSNDSIPPDLAAAMRYHLREHYSLTRARTDALLVILEQLEKSGVPAIPFKGPTLAERAFGDPGLRVFADLDILIPEQFVDQALECLLNIGYRHQAHLSLAQINAVRRYGGQYFMFHPRTKVCVEPHWSFTPTTLAVDVDYEYLWQHSVTTPFRGQPVLALAPEHEALMLCIHSSKEYWGGLKHIVDLAWFLHRHPALDWHSLLDDARRWGCLRMVLLGLCLCQSQLGIAIPTPCRPLVERDPVTQALSRKTANALRDGSLPTRNPYRIDSYRLSLRERWRDKLRLVLRTTITPRTMHYEVIELPRGLHWLYVPIKLGWDYMAIPLWKLVKPGRRNDTAMVKGRGEAQ